MHTTRDNDNLASVIVPVYNCEDYLSEAIESILAQTYRPIEIIVIDDGSTDNSAEIAKRFAPDINYFFQTNSGLGAALNQGIKLAQGNFFSFLDSDDLWMEDKLSRQMAVFKKKQDLDMVFGHLMQFHSPELSEDEKKRIIIHAGIMPGFFKGTMLIRRESFHRVGLFETGLKLGDFIDWYAKAKEQKLKSFMLSELVMKRRLHNSNMGINERDSRTDYLHILKRSLDRRRKMDSS